MNASFCQHCGARLDTYNGTLHSCPQESLLNRNMTPAPIAASIAERIARLNMGDGRCEYGVEPDKGWLQRTMNDKVLRCC